MPKSFKQIMDEARREIREVGADEVKARLERGDGVRVVDVR